MMGLFHRLRRALAARVGRDDRHASALAQRLGIGLDDARWILGRSRQVGYGAAMIEHEARCGGSARGAAMPPGDERDGQHRAP